MAKISIIIIAITILNIVYGLIKQTLNEKKAVNQPPIPLERGSYTVPWWERVLQVFLIFCTAAYALWVLGIKRIILQEISQNRDLRSLITVLIMSVLMIAGIYFYYIWAVRENLKALESKLPPKKRLIGYLKIIAV